MIPPLSPPPSPPPRAHSNTVHSIAWDVQRSLIFAGAADHSVSINDSVTGQALHQLKLHANCISAVLYFPRGAQLLAFDFDGRLSVYSHDFEMVRSQQVHDSPVSCARGWFQEGPDRVVTGSWNSRLHVWDLHPVEEEGTEPPLELLAEVKCGNAVRAVAWVAANALVASDVVNSLYVVESLGSRDWCVSTTLCLPSCATALCSDGRGGAFVASASGTLAVVTYGAGAWVMGPSWQAHAAECSCVAINSAGTLLASGAHDCLVKLWSTARPGFALLHVIRDHSSWISDVAFLPSSTITILGSASWDLVIRAFLLPADLESTSLAAAGAAGAAVVAASAAPSVPPGTGTAPAPPSTQATHTKEVLCVGWNVDHTLMCSGACFITWAAPACEAGEPTRTPPPPRGPSRSVHAHTAPCVGLSTPLPRPRPSPPLPAPPRPPPHPPSLPLPSCSPLSLARLLRRAHPAVERPLLRHPARDLDRPRGPGAGGPVRSRGRPHPAGVWQRGRHG